MAKHSSKTTKTTKKVIEEESSEEEVEETREETLARLEANCIVNDFQVQQRLFFIEGANKFKYCNGIMYIFDERTGMFNTNKEVLYYYMIKNKCFFNIRVGKSIQSYGTSKSLMNNILQFVKTASEDNDWLRETDASSLGYLLFKDGIYNMKTGEFKEGFDPNIVFYCRIPHNFPRWLNKKDKKKKEEDIAYVNSCSFDKIFKDPKPFKTAIACALAGDIELKKFYFCPGESNSGKSTLLDMLQNAFGDYVGDFNAESLAIKGKNDNKDEAQRHRWALNNRHSRILVSSEAEMDKDRPMSGSEIKKFASGGDTIIGRDHSKAEVPFVPHFTLFCLLNDVPTIKPLDEAVNNRLLYIEFPYIFGDEKKVEENPEVYRLLDPKFRKTIKEPRFINAFIHIILDTYKQYVANGEVMPEFDQVIKEEYIGEQREISMVVNKINEYFIFTKDMKDCISVEEMNKWKDKHPNIFSCMSPKKFNDRMKELGGVYKKSHSGPMFWHCIQYAKANKTSTLITINNFVNEIGVESSEPILIPNSSICDDYVTFEITELDD